MGRDKAMLAIDGERLWRRQVATLRTLAPDELLISAATGESFADSGVPIVQDATPGLGPLSGIAAALLCAENRTLLVLAVDLPSMNATFLRELLRVHDRTGGGVVPLVGDLFEPLAAIYTRECLSLADTHLRGDDRSMQRFVRAAIAQNLIFTHEIEPSQRPLFRNLNEPNDLL